VPAVADAGWHPYHFEVTDKKSDAGLTLTGPISKSAYDRRRGRSNGGVGRDAAALGSERQDAVTRRLAGAEGGGGASRRDRSQDDREADGKVGARGAGSRALRRLGEQRDRQRFLNRRTL